MLDAAIRSVLNRILIRLHRSVLQYAAECWPWAHAEEADEEQVLQKLIARQNQFVEQLATLLDSRGWIIDFGTFPDLSELHYVSLDYLVDELLDDQESLVSEVSMAEAACVNDPEAATLMAAIHESEKAALSTLKSLADALPRTMAATK